MLADWLSLSRLYEDVREEFLLGQRAPAPPPAIEKAFSERCQILFKRRARILIPAALIVGIFSLLAGSGLAGSWLPRTLLYGAHLTPFATVLLPLALNRRAALTLLLAILAAGGCYLLLLGDRAPWVAMPELFPLLISAGLSVWFGHTLFRSLRETHHRAHELAQLERTFQSRVDARTLELRRLLRHIESTREAERVRIARELHDELGQELSALRYELSFIRRRYEKEPGAIANNLESLEVLVRRTAATTRNLVSELRPRVLDDLGLPAAVQWLVERSAARSNLEIRCSVSTELASLDVRVASVAFRVLQEALTNVVRHAQARSAEVEALSREGTLELRVTDDGIGLKAALARDNRSGGHVGLIGMRERALSLGGRVEVSEREGGGTEVQVWLPLTPPPEDAPDQSNVQEPEGT